MNLQSLLNSAFSVKLGMLIGRTIPPSTGYKLAEYLAGIIANRKDSNLISAIRINQRIIRQYNVREEDLECITREVVSETAKCLYDYYHYINFPEKIPSLIEIDPSIQHVVDRIKNNQPTIISVLHTSNFELMGLGLHLIGVPFHILSISNPGEGYKYQNEIRKKLGLEITPMDFESFRQVKNKLRQGGSVLTGLDRPIEDPSLKKYRPLFFGYPASLPIAYVRLALDLNVPVCVFACVRNRKNLYSLIGSGLIDITNEGDDLHETMISNAEKVLREAEKIILKYPTQWSMFYRIWDEDAYQPKITNINKEVFR